jgi:hypothetical protein
MPLYRIHSNSDEAVDLNVWGPRGYHIDPDYDTVAPDGNGWMPLSSITKITRGHAALLLRWARKHNKKVQKFQR